MSDLVYPKRRRVTRYCRRICAFHLGRTERCSFTTLMRGAPKTSGRTVAGAEGVRRLESFFEQLRWFGGETKP
jgi:hypothetical protein